MSDSIVPGTNPAALEQPRRSRLSGDERGEGIPKRARVQPLKVPQDICDWRDEQILTALLEKEGALLDTSRRVEERWATIGDEMQRLLIELQAHGQAGHDAGEVDGVRRNMPVPTTQADTTFFSGSRLYERAKHLHRASRLVRRGLWAFRSARPRSDRRPPARSPAHMFSCAT